MDQIFEKSFDFSIRIIELTKYLDEEKKPFALRERLLKCGAGIGVYLRLAESIPNRSAESGRQALSYAVESEYLLETMAKTGYLTEKQSQPIISDCRALKTLIAGNFQKADGEKEGQAHSMV